MVNHLSVYFPNIWPFTFSLFKTTTSQVLSLLSFFSTFQFFTVEILPFRVLYHSRTQQFWIVSCYYLRIPLSLHHPLPPRQIFSLSHPRFLRALYLFAILALFTSLDLFAILDHFPRTSSRESLISSWSIISSRSSSRRDNLFARTNPLPLGNPWSLCKP